MTKDVAEDKAVPPEEAAYQRILVPVACKFETVAELQKVCEAVPVGAPVEFTVRLTVLEVPVTTGVELTTLIL